MTNIDNSVMDWNDVIEDDGQEYVLLLKRIITSLLLILKKEDSLVLQKFLLQIKKQNQFKFFLNWVLPQWSLTWFFLKHLIGDYLLSSVQSIKRKWWKITMDWNNVLGAKVELKSNKRYTQTNLVKKKYQWSRLLHWLRWEIF